MNKPMLFAIVDHPEEDGEVIVIVTSKKTFEASGGKCVDDSWENYREDWEQICDKLGLAEDQDSEFVFDPRFGYDHDTARGMLAPYAEYSESLEQFIKEIYAAGE